MWIFILIALATLLCTLYLYGVFKPMTLYTDELRNPLLLFYSWKGPRGKLGDQFSKITTVSDRHFKLSDGFGIYYSLPQKEAWDCALGLIVNPGEVHKVDNFLRQNPQFKSKQLSSISYIGSEIPYVNVLSFFLLPLKIPQFMANLQEQNHPVFPGSFEVYRFNFSPKRVELVNPLNHKDDLMLYEDE